MITIAQPHEHAAIFQDPADFDEFKRMPNPDFDGIVDVWGQRKGEQGLSLVAILADSVSWTLAEFRAYLKESSYDPIEMIEAREIRKSISVGDWVQFAVPKPPGPTTYATGKVMTVSTSSKLTSGDEEVEGTTDDPAIKLRVWARSEDGDKFTRTDRLVVRPASKLRQIERPDGIMEKQKIELNEQVKAALKRKVEEHNEKHGDTPSKRATYRMLEASMRRGIGAYKTNPGSVRPTVTSAEQWGYGRVNGLLHALRTGKFKRTPFDRDLLPDSHPLAGPKDDKTEKAVEYDREADIFDTPAAAKAKAEMLGIQGYHTHEINGVPKYMPGRSMTEYERAISKAIEPHPVAKAEWSTAYVNDLPDSAFFYIEEGGEKDDTGRTKPRSLRKLPYRDRDGSIDLPHLRNVLARLSQTDIAQSDRDRIRREARQLLEEATEKSVAKKYDDLDFEPPKGVQEAAELGLALRREHGRGGTLIGVARARDLAAGKTISPETIKRMTSFFARHEVDLDAPANRDRSDPGYPGAGRIAWLLWGGDPGRRWAEKLADQMKREDISKSIAVDPELDAVLDASPATQTDIDVSALRSISDSVMTWSPVGTRYIVTKHDGTGYITPQPDQAHENRLQSILSRLPRSTSAEVCLADQGASYAVDMLLASGVDVSVLGYGIRKALVDRIADDAGLLTVRGHGVIDGADAVIAARSLADDHGTGVIEVRRSDQAHGTVMTLEVEKHLKALWQFVRPRLADRPLAVIVTGNPNSVESIRGVPLAGPDGATFRKSYLDRLDLTIDDVTIVHACPAIGETADAWQPWLDRVLDSQAGVPVIALGKQASTAIGERRHTTMPHPRAVRRYGDRGEIERKAKAVRKNIDTVERLSGGSLHCPIIKSDDDKRIVYGVVLEPHSIDLQGDVIAIDTIETAAHKYLIEHRTVGDSHSRLAGAEVVESYLAPADLELGGQLITQGTWVMGVHVTDERLWQAVKSGEYSGFSIGGKGERKQIDNPI
jgi:hypothetical protein